MQQHNHQWLQWLWRVGQRSWLSHLFKAVHRLRETVLPDAGSPNPKFNPTLLELGALVEVMEHALSGIAKLDADGRYLYINKSYAEMVGLQPEAMIGMNWKQTVHPDHLEQLKSAYQQMLQDGKVELEARGIRTDGSSFYKQLVMISSYDQQQRFTGHYCFAKDISDRKQNEIALQNSQARFAGILEIASDAIISVNTAHQITLFNRGAERIFGYTSEEVLGQPLDILLPSQFAETHHQHIQQYGKSAGKARQMGDRGAVFGRRKDGTEFPAEASISKLTLDGELTFTTFLRDVSDRKQKEQVLKQAIVAAEAANLAKSMFLANMSHELRTPLNVILGFTQLMTHDPALTPAQLEDLKTIRRSGDHLLSLINQILDLSKIEAGYSAIEETGFDLIGLLHTLRSMMRERSQAKQLQLTFDIAPDVPQFIISDEQKLRQILLNLLTNAIKFTERGQVSLIVSVDSPIPQAERPISQSFKNDARQVVPVNTSRFISRTKAAIRDKEQLILRFAVTDTGVGIAPEEQEIIFDAFTQAEAGKESVTGTGLGLTISRKLLELMEGTISVQSTPQVGSTFICTVPVRPIHSAGVPSDLPDRVVLGLRSDQPTYRVLVVDDERENRRLMVRLMTLLGMEIREASHGQEAVQIWQDWQPDLIWMDIRMPGLDGYEATLRIRALEAASKAIIIALTAQASQSDRTLALAAGCNDYISKPFQEETLLLKMQEHLGLEYRYADLNPATDLYLHAAPPHPPEHLTPTRGMLPNPGELNPIWLKQLEEAAILGNDRMIATLTQQLPPHLAPLGDYITDLAQQFRFEEILGQFRGQFPP